MTSEVPQGSTLFLIYINYLQLKLNCSVSLHADDTLLYQAADTDEDAVRF